MKTLLLALLILYTLVCAALGQAAAPTELRAISAVFEQRDTAPSELSASTSSAFPSATASAPKFEEAATLDLPMQALNVENKGNTSPPQSVQDILKQLPASAQNVANQVMQQNRAPSVGETKRAAAEIAPAVQSSQAQPTASTSSSSTAPAQISQTLATASLSHAASFTPSSLALVSLIGTLYATFM
jgi:cytoskeletal protein RodZ